MTDYLFNNCEFDIDLIGKFSLYLDLCQIIEPDKDSNSKYDCKLMVYYL